MIMKKRSISNNRSEVIHWRILTYVILMECYRLG
jgi:hypothetical protein